MSNWVGYAVSVNCGETLGCYQGTILEADGKTITLTKAFRNGFPYPKSQVTLNASDIKDLRIIEGRSERAETHSTVAVSAPAARKSRATVCETLQANPTSTGNLAQSSNVINNSKSSNNRNGNQAGQPPTRSKPVEISATRNKTNHQAGSYGSGSTPKSGRRGGEWTGMPGTGAAALGMPGTGAAALGTPAGYEKARRRNEACFGDTADPALDDDFDFEGNLALFDKRAVWASMRNSKPDLVRAADESKYRHDENVLGGGGGAGGGGGGCVRVPEEMRGSVEYVTDEGVPVPSVTPAVRRLLWEGLQRHGLLDFALSMVARAACDVALRLVGGPRRLEARNAHQAPCVVCVAGAHRGGAAGLAAARLLRSRGALVHTLVSGTAPSCAPLQRELAALYLDGVPQHEDPGSLPAAPDLLLVALYDPLVDNSLAEYSRVCAWARGTRAATVCVEPPGGGWEEVSARACVMGLAVVPVSPALGRVYLSDVAAPARLYTDLRLHYRPPFGALPALPLHPQLD